MLITYSDWPKSPAMQHHRGGYLILALAVRGSQEARFTQPHTHKFALMDIIPDPHREVALGAGGGYHPGRHELKKAAALMKLPQLRSHGSRGQDKGAIAAVLESIFDVAHGPSHLIAVRHIF